MSKIIPFPRDYVRQGGLKVRTLAPLGNPDFKINWSHTAGKFNNRRENCEGFITNAIEGYGVDAYWVQHARGIAPYMTYELGAYPITLAQVIKSIFS